MAGIGSRGHSNPPVNVQEHRAAGGYGHATRTCLRAGLQHEHRVPRWWRHC